MTKIQHDSEKLAKGQQIITACAFIHHSIGGIEKVFLPKRASTKKFLPNVYELPGGHIEFGENLKDGLKREILEEFEMEIKIGDPFYVFDYKNEIKQSHSVEIIYFAAFIDSLEKIKLHPEDHSEFRWVSESEISEILNGKREPNDPEIMAMKKGFELLKKSQINFGF
jgi:ADP-ribose pyrophosphatase YjhB (NUDIX family)